MVGYLAVGLFPTSRGQLGDNRTAIGRGHTLLGKNEEEHVARCPKKQHEPLHSSDTSVPLALLGNLPNSETAVISL